MYFCIERLWVWGLAPEFNKRHVEWRVKLRMRARANEKKDRMKEGKTADEVIYCRETKYKQIDVYFDSSRIFIVFNKRTLWKVYTINNVQRLLSPSLLLSRNRSVFRVYDSIFIIMMIFGGGQTTALKNKTNKFKKRIKMKHENIMRWTFRQYRFTHSYIGVIIDILESAWFNLFISSPFHTGFFFFSISFCHRCLACVCMHCHLNVKNHLNARLCHWHSLNFNININTAFVSALSELVFFHPVQNLELPTISPPTPTQTPSLHTNVWNVWILFATGFLFFRFHSFISPLCRRCLFARLQFRMFFV